MKQKDGQKDGQKQKAENDQKVVYIAIMCAPPKNLRGSEKQPWMFPKAVCE